MRKQKSRQSRRNHSKNGSIMIMVVALLVLMALIGTAYIATARIDRGSASQNADNVQIGLLIDSVLNLCKTSISGDLFDGNGNYRPVPRDPFRKLDDPNDPLARPIPNGVLADAHFYYNITSTLDDAYTKQRIDCWLSDRTPDFGSTPSNNTSHYFWSRISHPLTTETDAAGPIRSFFEDPTYVPKAGDPLILRFRHDTQLEPTSIPIGGVPMPAFQIKIGNGFSQDPYTALAADADGDGIADSFLVRMPIGTINGLTYYYAVRIVDNAAAINLNTAWGDQVKMQSGSIASGNRLFPTSINLENQFGGPDLFTKQEVNSIHAYRTFSNTGAADPTPLGTELNYPRDDFGGVRKDFVFANEHDAFWMQMARRPENPGYIPSQSKAFRYHSFPLSEFVSLAPHFVLAPSSSGGIIDNTLLKDIPGNNNLSARIKPYAPSELALWGDNNFNYGSTTYNRRALVVTSNSVSTAISPHYMPNVPPNVVAIDLNEDDDHSNDVPSADMLDYVVSEPAKNTNPSAKPKYHLWKKTDTSWTSNKQIPHDYLQYELNGVTLNYVYARSDSATASAPDSPTGQDFWEFIPNLPTGIPMKTSLNTAGFRELYRSYWNVMCGTPSNQTPFGPDTNAATDPYADASNVQRQFRSSLRDAHKGANPSFGTFTYRFPPFQQLLLRAALAAVNTIDLRDSDDDVTSRTITLKYIDRNNTPRPVEVTVYGSEPQPFITEVYANTDNGTLLPNLTSGDANPKGYVAIELFNPYDHDISLRNWKLALVDRRRDDFPKNIKPPAPDPVKHKLRPLVTFGPTDIIRAKSYLVLDNRRLTQPPPAEKYAARNLPPNITVTGTARYVYELYQVFEDKDTQSKQANGDRQVGGELVILRPRRADGNYTSRRLPYDTYNEQANLYDLVPVDQFDFSGLQLEIAPTVASGNLIKARYWHYVRQSDTSGDARWKCVYPGRYRAGKPNYEDPRHDFDSSTTWDAPRKAGELEPSPVHPIKLGSGDTAASYNNPFPPIQINNLDFGGPNPIQQATGNKFPFGGFQRVGDIMQVPFMGAYRVRELDDPNGNGNPVTDTTTGGYKLKTGNTADMFLELSSLPMDCSFADDSENGDDMKENIGRFCPILAPGFTSYDFARRIFDYFTVIAPNEDYLPNVNPDRTPDPNKNNTSIYRTTTGGYQNIMGAASGFPKIHADPVWNIDSGSSASTSEELTGIHGQININTANWKVLSTIPFTNNAATNAAIAKAIVAYRDANGPFTSLFDLYLVNGFKTNQPISDADDPDDNEGDFSPDGLGNKDGVIDPHEFEKEYLLITRISNLLTTRSDSFTAYVLVQGWRNANTPQAELVVQRRAAMLIDRSGVTRDNRETRTMLIPVE